MSLDSGKNIAIGLGKLTYSGSDDFDHNENADFTTLSCTLYSNNLFHFIIPRKGFYSPICSIVKDVFPFCQRIINKSPY